MTEYLFARQDDLDDKYTLTLAAKVAAEAAQTAAETAQTGAETAETNAQTAQTNAETAQTAAETAQTAAETAQGLAETAKTNTEAVYDAFDDRYLGAKASEPSVDNDGNVLVAGALFFHTGVGMKVWNGASWDLVPGLLNIVDDTTPQLGGDLDTNSHSITGLSALTLSGTNGLDVTPGSDTDADLITVNVTGTPTLSWDEASNAFRTTTGVVIDEVGTGGDLTHTIAGTSIASLLELHSDSGTNPNGMVIHTHSGSNPAAGHFLGLRSRGTHSSPTIVADNDVLAWIMGVGYDGTDYEFAAAIQFLIDGTPANNDMPGEIAFFTNAGSQTLTKQLSIRADGSIEATSGTMTLNSSQVLVASDIGSSVQGYDADTLFADTADTLTAGYKGTSNSIGTITGSSPTTTPNVDNGNIQHLTLDGSSLTGTWTLNPPTGPTTLLLEVVNGGTGAVGATLDTSAFDRVDGAWETTNGNDYQFHIAVSNTKKYLNIVDVT